jgi:hypothetical protein
MAVPTPFDGQFSQQLLASAPKQRLPHRLLAVLGSTRNFYFPPVLLNENLQRVLAEREFTALARRTIFWFATLLVSAALVRIWGEPAPSPPIPPRYGSPS